MLIMKLIVEAMSVVPHNLQLLKTSWLYCNKIEQPNAGFFLFIFFSFLNNPSTTP